MFHVSSRTRYPLVDRKLEGRESVCPAVDRSLVIDAHPGIVLPDGSSGPLAELLNFARVSTSRNGSVEACGLDAVLNPVNHRGHVVLWVRAVGLKSVGRAVSGTRDQVELIPVFEGLERLLV